MAVNSGFSIRLLNLPRSFSDRSRAGAESVLWNARFKPRTLSLHPRLPDGDPGDREKLPGVVQAQSCLSHQSLPEDIFLLAGRHAFSRYCPDCPLRNGVKNVLATGISAHDQILRLTLLIGGKPVERLLRVNAGPVVISNSRYVIVAIDDVTSIQAGLAGSA